MPETRENKPDTAPGVAQYFEADRATDIESDNNGAQYRENHEQQGFQADSPGKTIRFESSRIAQPNDKQNPPKVWLSAETSANLCAIPLRTFQDRTSKGIYEARPVEGNGRGKLEILLDSLPARAQAAYYIECRKASGIGQATPALLVDMDEREALWERFYAASEKLQERAWNACGAVIEFNRLLDSGTQKMQAYQAIQEEFKVSRNTLNGYIAATERFDRMDWPARLLPTYAGKAARLEWHPDAWKFFMAHALTPRAKVDIAYRRTVEEGGRQGWPQLPNIKTARQAIKDLPATVKTLVKEGPTALKRLAPTVMRDYSTYALNEVWSMDGRKLDLAVIDTKGRFGEKGRLLRVWLYAFLDFRSRYPVGYALSATLDADLVRDAFLDAIKTTGRIIPQRIAPDNGMEVAAKEHTGGAPWRRRGKVKADEMIGTFPQLGIEVDWALVAHGQTKPVERFFRTLATNLETQPELRGAYLGTNAPDRPEECERSKAAPLELVESLLHKAMATLKRTPHRGDSMDGKSPEQMYHELMQAQGFMPRQITEAQRRMCALSRTEITIRGDGSFTILGARYYSTRTAELNKGRGYWATFNRHDLAEPVTVYQGTTKLAENVKQIERTPGNCKEAAKRIMKEKSNFKRATKAQAKALGAIQSAESGHIAKLAAEKFPEIVNKETGEILPPAKVIQLVQSKAEPASQPTRSDAEESARLRKLADQIGEIQLAEGLKQAFRR
ncbi:MAG: hypothetical protein C0466_08990 [Candidatus Accumulibacter sp.]|nr:hypothetical protein [Accumulibacter sp.]